MHWGHKSVYDFYFYAASLRTLERSHIFAQWDASKDGFQLFLRRYGATHGVIGAQRVEGVGPTHKKAAMLIQQYLHIVTALLLQRWRPTQRKRKQKEGRKIKRDSWGKQIWIWWMRLHADRYLNKVIFLNSTSSCLLNAWIGHEVSLTVQLHYRAHDQSLISSSYSNNSPRILEHSWTIFKNIYGACRFLMLMEIIKNLNSH